MPDFTRSSADNDKSVPFFGSWRNAYIVVLAIFILEVAFFYFVSRWFL